MPGVPHTTTVLCQSSFFLAPSSGTLLMCLEGSESDSSEVLFFQPSAPGECHPLGVQPGRVYRRDCEV